MMGDLEPREDEEKLDDAAEQNEPLTFREVLVIIMLAIILTPIVYEIVFAQPFWWLQ